MSITLLTIILITLGLSKNMGVVCLCRQRAEDVKDATNSTKQALDVSEDAIEKARTALKDARSNLNNTRNATAEVQSESQVG